DTGDTSGGIGVYGENNLFNGIGMQGQATLGTAVYGSSDSGTGVSGRSNTGYGVWAASSSDAGVYTTSSSGDGVHTISSSGNGVTAISITGHGVNAHSNGVGIPAAALYAQAFNNSGIAVFAGANSTDAAVVISNEQGDL